MMMQKLCLAIFFLSTMQAVQGVSMIEQLGQQGYIELYDQKHDAKAFDTLYEYFDEFITFLQAHPKWAHNIYQAKERFIRSKDKDLYSSDICGFYDESKKIKRSQISFYYSTHFHALICSLYPEIYQIPQLISFLQACYAIEQPYEELLHQISIEMGVQDVFISADNHCPLLLKVIKYLPSYTPYQPHYDGSVITLFLDSTENQALALAPYRSSYSIDDFYVPLRKFNRYDHQRSMLLIPGTLLTEFAIYPTPHIVIPSGKIRYAAIAFGMRPHYSACSTEFSILPNFKN